MTTVLEIYIDAVNYSQASKMIGEWAAHKEGRFVCAANTHMIMESHDVPLYKQIINSSDLVVPDGMPVVWMMRLKGQKDQRRVYGPTLMLHVLDLAACKKIPIGFYGGSPEVLGKLILKMQERFQELQIVYAFSPPFRDLNESEKKDVVQEIKNSGAQILFVGLGCPRQEVWMAEQRNAINAVMLGVGAAFDFHAGVKPQSPAWLQRLGLEWFFRLLTEPRRLWRRYLYHNPRFVVLAILDLLGVYK